MWITTMVSAWDFPSNQSILLGFWRCWIAHWLDGATKIPSPDTKSLEFQIVIIYPYISHDSPKRYPCYHGGLKKSTDVIPFYPHLMSPLSYVCVSMTMTGRRGAQRAVWWSMKHWKVLVACLGGSKSLKKTWWFHGVFFSWKIWMVCF